VGCQGVGSSVCLAVLCGYGVALMIGALGFHMGKWGVVACMFGCAVGV
jgi:hypothetical protein